MIKVTVKRNERDVASTKVLSKYEAIKVVIYEHTRNQIENGRLPTLFKTEIDNQIVVLSSYRGTTPIAEEHNTLEELSKLLSGYGEIVELEDTKQTIFNELVDLYTSTEGANVIEIQEDTFVIVSEDITCTYAIDLNTLYDALYISSSISMKNAVSNKDYKDVQKWAKLLENLNDFKEKNKEEF